MTTAIAVIAVLAAGTVPAAAAIGTRDIELELRDTLTLGADSIPSGMKVDSQTHVGYVIDRTSKAVLGYDLTSGRFRQVASIPTTFDQPNSLSLDGPGNRLLVGSLNLPSIAIIDIDPSSGSFNTLVGVIGTGGVYPFSIAVDGEIAYVADQPSSPLVARLNLRDGTVTTVSTGRSSKRIAIDPATHIVYVSGTDDKTIWEITPDGRVSAHPLSFVPSRMTITPGGLLVAASDGLVRLDRSSWTVTGSNPAVRAIQSLVYDEPRGMLYATSDQDVNVLDVNTLSLVASFRPASGASYLDVDQQTGAVLVCGSAAVEMYSATPTVTRVSGGDRYEVSAAVSKRQFAPMVPVVYVASGEVFSDALSASAAAGAHGGAVLLVRKNEIPRVVATELTRLTPQRIVLLGGSSTISATVENELKSFSTDVIRIAGADRYEVSATVSSKAFGSVRPVAYIAAGTTFADALSGSAAAGRLGGPVLLVPKDSVPSSISDELSRLAPTKIVVLGGADSVSQAVVDALALIQPNTVRIAGDDRFAVSAKVSFGAFPTPTTTVYVSSGLTYPDALSGSAAAIATGSPVLLVRSDSIPTAIAAELDRLNPRRIVILGGNNSVSDAVAAKLKSFITV